MKEIKITYRVTLRLEHDPYWDTPERGAIVLRDRLRGLGLADPVVNWEYSEECDPIEADQP